MEKNHGDKCKSCQSANTTTKVTDTSISNARFNVLDGIQLPFENGTFDIVATNKGMHHIPEWQSAFTERVRTLRPNGYLLYSGLMYPKWLAFIGNTYARKYAGFPTKSAINELVSRYPLRQIYVSSSVAQYEVIFQSEGLGELIPSSKNGIAFICPPNIASTRPRVICASMLVSRLTRGSDRWYRHRRSVAGYACRWADEMKLATK